MSGTTQREVEERLAKAFPGLSLHHLYEASVQNVDADVDFIDKAWSEVRSGMPLTLREDFCGTASLCAEWVGRSPERQAWGVDLDQPTLDWGMAHRIEPLGDAASRVTLLNGDVRTNKRPLVDVQVAFNFSYFIFKTRDALREYFEAVHSSLNQDGIFLVDVFGGVESEQELEEKTKHEEQVDADGTEIPEFVYSWDQHRFNALDRSLECAIHFRTKRPKIKVRSAFTYDWRFWTVAELRELLTEAGFERTLVYSEDWDDDEDEPDGNFQRRNHLANEGGFVAYVVAVR